MSYGSLGYGTRAYGGQLIYGPFNYSVTITDSLALTDVETRTVAHYQILLDNVGMTDSDYTLNVTIAIVADDGMGLIDTITQTATFSRPLTDTESETDVISRTATADRSVEDVMGLTDVNTFTKLLIAYLTDVLGVTDITDYRSLTTGTNIISFDVIDQKPSIGDIIDYINRLQGDIIDRPKGSVDSL
jgi:hypothetical protein